MKKFVSIAISFVLALGAIAGFAACGDGDEDDTPGGTPHTHKYATTWSYDSSTHWHAATCDDLDYGDEGYKKDEAAHGTPDANGKCPTCGYQIKGTMTLAQFKETAGSGEKIRDFARKQVIGFTDAAKEFVWVTADETTNKISSLLYLYIDSSGNGGNCSLRGSDIDVTFDAIVAGTATASGSFNGGSGIATYDLSAQAEKEELGAAAFTAYQAHPDTATNATYDPTYTTPLLRLVSQRFSSAEGKTNIYFLDVFATGYVQYRLVVTTSEEQTDEQLIALLGDASNITTYVGRDTYANAGELVYSNQ